MHNRKEELPDKRIIDDIEVVAAVWGVGVGVFALHLTVIERFFVPFFPLHCFSEPAFFLLFSSRFFFWWGFSSFYFFSYGVGFCF